MALYSPISPIIKEWYEPEFKKIITFDPSEIYSRIKIDKFERRQSLSIEDGFPTLKAGTCACGCGNEITGRRKRWAADGHSDYCYNIMRIIKGDTQFIKKLMGAYLPFNCCKCGCENYTLEKQNMIADGIQVDHIIAVKNGGGGCWLGNYQFICHKCHSKKTAMDNQLRNKQPVMPLSVEYV